MNYGKYILLLAIIFLPSFVFSQADIESDTGEIASYWHKPEGVIGGNPDVFPVYKFGGDTGMMKFLAENIKYPQHVEGTVFVSFIVDTLGNVRRPKILKGLSDEADKEVLRVVKMLKFTPAMLNGEKVARDYNLPVKFSLK
jgi:protein TonB